MLIVVDDDMVDIVQNLVITPNANQISGIDALLRLHANGNHLVVASTDFCAAAISLTGLSLAAQAAAKKIVSRRSEYFSLVPKVTRRLSISARGIAPTKEGLIWSVPFLWFCEHGLRETILLAENLTDCDVLKRAATDYLGSEKLSHLRVVARNVLGGGGTTHSVLNNVCNVDHDLCICVVDSDRASPVAENGQTAKQCEQVVCSSPHELVITRGRELENHIPRQLHIHMGLSNEHTTQLDRMGIVDSTSIHYADFKKGVSGFDLHKALEPQCKAYWRQFDVAANKSCVCSVAECLAATRGECNMHYLRGAGSALLKTINIWFQGHPSLPYRSPPYATRESEPVWFEIGQTVAEWTLGLDRMRS